MAKGIEKKDLEILKSLHNDFPVLERPYKEIGERLNIPERYVFKRVKTFKRKNLIRGIGPNLNLERLCLKTTLIALKAPKKGLEKLIRFINSYRSITHNYLRDNEFNIWFTFSYKEEKEKNSLLSKIKKIFNIQEILDLETIDRIKLKTNFFYET
jgi:DNA-binding Lrp family transcriptional regulator